MISSHVGAITETAGEIETDLRQVLRGLARPQDEQQNIPELRTWQLGAAEAFGKVQAVDRLLKTAFTKTNSSSAPIEAMAQLPTALSVETAVLLRYRSFTERESNFK